MGATKEFGALMSILFSIYDQGLSDIKVNAYFSYLGHYSINQLKWAIDEYVRNDSKCEFFPRPGQLIKLIDNATTKQLENDAYEKWAQVYESICSGNYHHDDDNVNLAIRQIGGWSVLRNMLESEQHFKCRDFVDRYKAICEKNEVKKSYERFMILNPSPAPKLEVVKR